jgi:hypothetical protein
MKRNLAGLFALCALVSCASAPPPQWVENLEAAFPGDRYIATLGISGSRETVSQAAQTALSSYFQTKVSSSMDMAESYSEQDGAVSHSMQLKQQTLVQTETVLRTVQHTAPWRNPATGLWEAAAYIELEKAWEAFSPQAQKAADTLAHLFQGAQKAGDPFARALLFGKAEAYAAGEEFVTARGFAQILRPVDATKLFEEADSVRSALPRGADDARQNASVYLGPHDLDDRIRKAATAAFSDAGFPVATETKGAAVECEIRVNEGLMSRPPGTGTFYHPELSGEVKSLAGARSPVFSFTVQAEVQSAIDPALALSRAYTALAQALRDTLPKRLRE